VLSPELEQILASASADAYQRKHPTVGIEHVVMAIIARSEPARILEDCGAKLGKLTSEIDRYLDDQPCNHDNTPLVTSPELASALQHAASHAQGAKLSDISVGNLLVAMLAERSFAVAALRRHRVTRLAVMSYLVHGVVHDSASRIPQARLVSRWKPWTRAPVADRCEVVMYDDPYTRMEFVVDVLMSVFDLDRDDAHALMLAIHECGSGIVGSYSFAEATALVAEVTERAYRAEFPLKVSIVPTTAPAR
jgi:ATP-dependent Clp protease adaptor protein ClpS